MTDKHLLANFGLKWNPFQPDLPVEALWIPPHVEMFIKRMEQRVRHGGFAMICGEPGLGKSKCLQLLAHHLNTLEDVTVGVMERPQSSISDFYREMGSLFEVNLSPANRYGGFKMLRERWENHLKHTLYRPTLLIDEAQEMTTGCLNELRLLQSEHFDSRSLLTIVLCGDKRLPQRFRMPELAALGSRIQARLNLEPYSPDALSEYLEHAITQAGTVHLMSESLMATLADHAAGNLRVLNAMSADLLTTAVEKDIAQLDEKLFMEVASGLPRTGGRRKKNVR